MLSQTISAVTRIWRLQAWQRPSGYSVRNAETGVPPRRRHAVIASMPPAPQRRSPIETSLTLGRTQGGVGTLALREALVCTSGKTSPRATASPRLEASAAFVSGGRFDSVPTRSWGSTSHGADEAD
jgi:hypothetical protein